MKNELITNILNGYENQLLNAEIKQDLSLVIWLNEQINEAKKALATQSIF